MVLAAKVWTYWLAVPIFVASVLACIGLVVGYFVKVKAPQYPGRRR